MSRSPLGRFEELDDDGEPLVADALRDRRFLEERRRAPRRRRGGRSWARSSSQSPCSEARRVTRHAWDTASCRERHDLSSARARRRDRRRGNGGLRPRVASHGEPGPLGSAHRGRAAIAQARGEDPGGVLEALSHGGRLGRLDDAAAGARRARGRVPAGAHARRLRRDERDDGSARTPRRLRRLGGGRVHRVGRGTTSSPPSRAARPERFRSPTSPTGTSSPRRSSTRRTVSESHRRQISTARTTRGSASSPCRSAAAGASACSRATTRRRAGGRTSPSSPTRSSPASSSRTDVPSAWPFARTATSRRTRCAARARSSCAPGRSGRRICSSSRGSARADLSKRPASRSCTSTRRSVRTCSTTSRTACSCARRASRRSPRPSPCPTSSAGRSSGAARSRRTSARRSPSCAHART